MNYDILNYRKLLEIKAKNSNDSMENHDLLNDYISIQSQISRIYRRRTGKISEEIDNNTTYKNYLFNVLIENTPFKNFTKNFKRDFKDALSSFSKFRQVDDICESPKQLTKTIKIPNKEVKSIRQCQNQMIDGSISKIINILLSILKCNLLKNETDHDDKIFHVIEESIKELPMLILSKTINESHESSIAEIKRFILEMISENTNERGCRHSIEIWLLLYTRVGGLDNILQWLDMVFSRLDTGVDIMIRTECLSIVLESLFIGGDQLTMEIRDHMKDCLEIDILDQETMGLPQAINCLFLGILRAFKIHLKSGTVASGTVQGKSDSKNHLVKDIYIWEHGDELHSIKAPYPDSLLIRLNSSGENYSINQVICCQKELVVVNTLGQVRSKAISNKHDNITKLLVQCWSPIHFPDINCKIDHISVGWPTENEQQHILALSQSGQVFSWGGGNFGKLGHGDMLDRHVPTLIEGLRGYNIKKISTGISHSSAVSVTGLAFIWGNSINFNGKNSQICLTPKRLQQGIMSNILCGPRSTFLLSINKRNIYYLGSQYPENKLYTDKFLLKSYPNLIEGLPFIHSDKSEKIDKIVMNSSGVIVLLNNGILYSIGHGLILGCPNCQIHKLFEPVKSMSEKIVLDVAVSETHVAVLSHNMVYSWSLTGTILVLVQESFNYSLTSISADALIEQNKQINIVWSKHYDSSPKMFNSPIRSQNPYLSVISPSSSVEHFLNILRQSIGLLKVSPHYENLILNTLKLFSQCLKSNQFGNLSNERINLKKNIDELMKTLFLIGDYEGINEHIKKVICTILSEMCSIFYQESEDKVDCIFEIISSSMNPKSLSFFSRFVLKHLLLSFNDELEKVPFFKLFQLSLSKLDDLLISICKITSTYTISVFQGKMATNRSEYPDESLGDLCILLHQFSTIGYRIFLSQLDRQHENFYNPISNLCSLLPLTNSIIGCFKSYLIRENKSQKISNWIKTRGTEINLLLSKSPMSWILFDSLNYLIDQDKLDILPLIPHLERLIISLDSVNTLLPNTTINDAQETHWPLYGFSGFPNISNTLPEPGSPWLWLLDLERLAGLILGNLFQKELTSSILHRHSDNPMTLNKWLETPLFKYISRLPVNKVNEQNKYERFSPDYDNLLKVMMNQDSSDYYIWSEPTLLYSVGLHIYATFIYLSNSKCFALDLNALNKSFVIYRAIQKVFNMIVRYIKTLIGVRLFAPGLEMTKTQEDQFRTYMAILHIKCTFLMSLFKESFRNHEEKPVNESQSVLIDALDLAVRTKISATKHYLSRPRSLILQNDIRSSTNYHSELELMEFLNEVQEGLESFLVPYNIMDGILENNLIEATKSYLQNLSIKIYFKRTSIDRVSKVFMSLNRLLDPSKLSIDSVLIQILNTMLNLLPYTAEQIHESHYELLGKIFLIMLKKLNQYFVADNKWILSQRIAVSIINFLSSYNFGLVNLINILIDGHFMDSIICMTNNCPFITTEKWLIIEGNGDNNLPNVCNIIGWCILNNFILSLSLCDGKISAQRMHLVESQLRKLALKTITEITNGNTSKIFDLYSIIQATENIYNNSQSFRNGFPFEEWLELLLNISTDLGYLERQNMFYSRYSVHLIAMEFLFSILNFEGNQEQSRNKVETAIPKIFQRYSDLFYCLIRQSAKLETMKITKSLDCRANIYKHFCGDFDYFENCLQYEWTTGNPNFDKINSLKCEFLTNDKVSITSQYSSNNFMALNSEDLTHGIWRVVFDIECKESSIDFSYGFIVNQKDGWPKDHFSLMKLLKLNAPLSISCRSSVSHRLSCIIDLDKCFVYFSKGNDSIQPFINSGGIYRFFISSFKSHSSSFQIQMLSIKQLCDSELEHSLGFYNNILLSPDHYILMDALHCGFNKLFSLRNQWIQEHVITTFIKHSEYLKQFDLYFDKNIYNQSLNNSVMFALFLLNDCPTGNGFYQGELCQFHCNEEGNDVLDNGIILSFQIKEKTQFSGLNFLDKLTKDADIQCSIYAFASKKNISLSLSNIQKCDGLTKSVYLKAINNASPNDSIVLISALYNCISLNYFDVDISNYDGMEWLNEISEKSKVEFHFIKCLCSQLLMQILSKGAIIDIYIASDNEKHLKHLEKIYSTVTSMASKSSPLRQIFNCDGFLDKSYKLLDCFYQISAENELNLVKKYAQTFMENYHVFDLSGYLDESEQKLLFRALKKQPFGQTLIDSFTMKSRDNTLSSESRAISFSDRRRKLNDHVMQNRIQSFQNQIPAEEYDMNISNQRELQETEAVLLPETINEEHSVEANQRFMDEFIIRSVNKSKRSCICPICDTVLKSQIHPLFDHLSFKHPHNCRKSFQHYASYCIKSDGKYSDLDDGTLYCATVMPNGYCVCKEYLANKTFYQTLSYPSENFNIFCNKGFINNILIGWSGTLATENYYHEKISDIGFSEKMRPKLDQTKILGDHIQQEINYSKIALDSLNNEGDSTNKSLFDEIPFVALLNCTAIIKALHRIEYANIVLSARKLIVKLTKLIFRKPSRMKAIVIAKRFFLTDSTFFMNIVRLVEGGRINLDMKQNRVVNQVRCIDYSFSDFLSVLLMGLESGMETSEQIHNFMVLYIFNLEHFLISSQDYFTLNSEYDATILIRPSTLLIQLLFNTAFTILSNNNGNYQYWQIEVEQIMELLAFGITADNTISKVKIWCLHSLMKMFHLIETHKLSNNLDFISMVDLCEDLGLEDSPAIHLANCNATVKKLISVMNRRHILTADCEGTMRLWDIDSIGGTEQNLRQTFLFSLGDQFFKEASIDGNCPEIMEKCLRMAEPLKCDLSNYLVQVGVQKIAFSPSGFYLAESLGIYLNIWSTKSTYSRPPYVISFASLITALIFPRQTFSGLLGCSVELLLVALADGDILLLRIFDNGTRVTQHQIPGLSDIALHVTTVAWDEEKNPIVIGYHDGTIVFTDQKSDKVLVDTVHNNRILILLYCPYPTQHGQSLLASSSFDEEKIAIWKIDRLLCLIKLPASISCLEWLSKAFIFDEKHHIIIAGTSTGLIQFWQLDNSGDRIENLFTFCGHLSQILKLKVCENTNLLASGCSNGWINVWHIKDRSLISTCRGDGSVIGMDWSTQNNLVAAFSRSQYIKIWRYFNNNTMQKSGLRQWAHVRKLILQSNRTKSINHLKYLKFLVISLHNLLNDQYLEEVESLKSGFSIVYSQYLRIVIQFITSLDLIPKFMSGYPVEPIDNSEYVPPSHRMEIKDDNYGQRSSLTHYLNLNNTLSCQQFDWLFSINETANLTQCLSFEREISLNIIPRWWWVWCIGSSVFLHHYLHAKWTNNFWSVDKQVELYQWYQNSPEQWIKEYSNSTYIWGCGIKGEFGMPTTADWIRPTLIEMEGIQQIICGSGVTLILTCDGKLMACGEGLEIIFNPFMREGPYRIINVPVLNDYRVTHVSASRGPESHIIAITSFGEVFSWGIGSYGKLGHGHATTLKNPKLIETLRGKGAIMADCGDMHSAVVTASGELYTFGMGTSGQLGIEILSVCDTPRLVDFDNPDFQVGYAACGTNHTLALSTDGLTLYAFGEGTYGKLGVGDFKDHFSPVKVDLKGKSLFKIVCGKDFSAALVSNGDVLTWGHSNFTGIALEDPESDDIETEHIPYPFVNPTLSSIGIVVDICAGNDTGFAITATGHLYGWGSNINNLLRLGSKSIAYKPKLISINKDIHLRQISCGRYHAAASSHAPNTYRNYIPTGPQVKHDYTLEKSLVSYPALNDSELNTFDMTARLVFILYWNEMVRLTWQFWIPQTNQHYDISDFYPSIYNFKCCLPTLDDWPIVDTSQCLFPQSNWNWTPFKNFQNDVVRQLLNNEFVSSILYRYLNGSMFNNRTFNSLVIINRIDKTDPVFIQTSRQVLKMDVVHLRLPWRAWKVKLVNEGADDAGGAYDETISEICSELANDQILPRVLIPIPSDPTTFILNSDPNVPVSYFNFLGILIATAIRTKKPIDLNLDPLFWKRLTKSTVTTDDLISIDPAYFNSLLSMKHANTFADGKLEEIYAVDKFICFSLNGTETEVIYKGVERTIEDFNLSNFVNSCMYYRLHEFDNAIENVRKSFCSIAPMVLLDLISWNQMEKLVCGSKSVSTDILKSIARYVDVDETDIIITWFWEILESFTESEKGLFLRFVTGKSRLPSQGAHIPFRLFIYISKQPINSLPQSQTCFNQIRLPRYKCRMDMETKLRIAINQCRSIDMDDYMLTRNREQ